MKYLLAFLVPASCLLAIDQRGIWSFATVIFAFVLVPIVEHFFPGNDRNLPESTEPQRASVIFYDVLLLLNIPIVYALLWYYLQTVLAGGIGPVELVGMTLSTGITLGACGTNVGHELGHRQSLALQFCAKLLLLPCLNLHFFIEHNRGHHKDVGTPFDPATARLGEPLYAFWVRSALGAWMHAWVLEKDRLRVLGKRAASPNNQMIVFTLASVVYLGLLVWWGGWPALAAGIAIALLSHLLLETINYIEHYGLRRNLTPSGHYEPVTPAHSWNSDHELGRILLYELTRHSDHHYKSTRKYQILRHLKGSPQLPYGYPSSMLLAMLPPLWFSIMNPLVQKAQVL